MERTGEVTAVRGEMLEITFCRPADCEKCNACHGGSKQTTLTLKGQAAPGDLAVVDMPVKTLMEASALAYGLALVGLSGKACSRASLLPATSDLGGAIGAAGRACLSLIPLVITERRRRAIPLAAPPGGNHPQAQGKPSPKA